VWPLLAQAAQPSPDSWIGYLGPFVPFGGLAVWIILALRAELKTAREQLEMANDRAQALAERAIPALTEATDALRVVADRLRERDG